MVDVACRAESCPRSRDGARVKLDITWFNAPHGGFIVAWIENDEFYHEHVETAEEAMRLVGAVQQP